MRTLKVYSAFHKKRKNFSQYFHFVLIGGLAASSLFALIGLFLINDSEARLSHLFVYPLVGIMTFLLPVVLPMLAAYGFLKLKVWAYVVSFGSLLPLLFIVYDRVSDGIGSPESEALLISYFYLILVLIVLTIVDIFLIGNLPGVKHNSLSLSRVAKYIFWGGIGATLFISFTGLLFPVLAFILIGVPTFVISSVLALISFFITKRRIEKRKSKKILMLNGFLLLFLLFVFCILLPIFTESLISL